MQRPDFSAYARQYALARPTYPVELFDWLAGLVSEHGAVWDCATGNGQAAVALAGHFDTVVATDISEQQIANAHLHHRVHYRVAPAEASGLADASVDLVTVASAVHWFDLDAFGREASRVLRPHGVLAVWTYHVGHMASPFDDLFGRIYRETLHAHFPDSVRLVDECYATVDLPGTPIDSPDFTMTADWTLDQLLAFADSWSGVQAALEKTGAHPLDAYRDELAALWGDPEAARTLRWPLYVRATRM